MNLKICVIGSLNMDVVFTVDQFLQPGETMFAKDVTYSPGGKGANQAVAAANLGSDVTMIGKVGDDQFGKALLATLKKKNVNTAPITEQSQSRTGMAMITVNSESENQILLNKGANFELTTEDIDQHIDVIQKADIIMLQLEIPLHVVEHVVNVASKLNKTILLDPAPAPVKPLPNDMLEKIDIILPNVVEAEAISKQKIYDLKTAKLAAATILSMGVNTVIIKLGADGALLAENNRFEHIAAKKANVVDTTAAGDAFVGGFAAYLGRAVSLRSAIEIANIVGAKATEKKGAIPSLPTPKELEINESLLID